LESGEAEYGARFSRIHAFIEQALAQEDVPADFRQATGEPTALDAFLYDTVLPRSTCTT
jgi:hypothetical protein